MSLLLRHHLHHTLDATLAIYRFYLFLIIPSVREDSGRRCQDVEVRWVWQRHSESGVSCQQFQHTDALTKTNEDGWFLCSKQPSAKAAWKSTAAEGQQWKKTKPGCTTSLSHFFLQMIQTANTLSVLKSKARPQLLQFRHKQHQQAAKKQSHIIHVCLFSKRGENKND